MSASEPATESSFRFTGFNLTRFEFVRSDSQWQQMPPHSLEVSRSAYVPNDQSVVVKVSVRVAWQDDGPFDLSLEGVGRFEFDGEIAEDVLKRLSDFQAPALVYTQLRPLARLVAAEAGFPAFLLPTINFAQMAATAVTNPPESGPHGLPE